jgi:hypothetical protein
MLITSYYDIYNRRDRFPEYLSLFYDLGTSGIPIIVFTDPSLVSQFKVCPGTVQVIGIPLEGFELYKLGMNYNGSLPLNRNYGKDTKEFLSLMNTKIEFIKRGAESMGRGVEDTFIWIDFGILKIIKNTDAFIKKLREINAMTFDKIIMPGCWPFGNKVSCDSVHWRFCGGIFVMPRKYIQTFYEHSRNVLTDFCTNSPYKLCWETNVWAVIEACAMKDTIQWFSANHNDSILLNIDSVITNQ